MELEVEELVVEAATEELAMVSDSCVATRGHRFVFIQSEKLSWPGVYFDQKFAC